MSESRREVEQRIIEMRFQNAQFKTAAGETMKALKGIDDGLKSVGTSSESISKLGNTFDKLDSSSLRKLNENVDAIAQHFTWFGRTADRIFDRFTDRVIGMSTSAIGAIKNLANEFLGFDPNLGGFHEYENMMTSIQTIKTNTASKGTTLDEINAALAELNEYADLTIYNFQEMTRNIGTFTAAGVELEDAVAAIKGISNLGAGVGSTPAQVATAMYQMSQALAAGTVNLQDWNSVVNAGMGGEYFQNALKETARTLAAQRGMIVETFEGTFRESISGKDGTGWLTSEVLLETLKKFATDDNLLEAATRVKTFSGLVDTMKESVGSGWTTTWQLLLGDLDEAADLFTMMSHEFEAIIGPIHDSRNEMLRYWKDMGGRDMLIQSLVNAFNALKSILRPIKQAWDEAFPPMTGERLLQITESIYRFGEGLGVGERGANRLYLIFSTLFNLLSFGLKILAAASDYFFMIYDKAAEFIFNAFGTALDVIILLDEWLAKVHLPFTILGDDVEATTERFDGFRRIGRIIVTIFTNIYNAAITAGAALWGFVSSFALNDLSVYIDNAKQSIADFYEAFKTTAFGKQIDNLVQKGSYFFNNYVKNLSIVQNLRDFVQGLIDAFNSGETTTEKFQNSVHYIFTNLKSLRDVIRQDWKWPFSKEVEREGSEVSTVLIDKKKIFTDFIESFKKGSKDVKETAKDILGNVKDFVIPIWNDLAKAIRFIKDELKGLSFADVISIIASIESMRMWASIRHVFDGVADVIESIATIEKTANDVLVAFKNSFQQLFSSVGDTLKAFQFEIKTKALMNIAVAIAILSAAIFGLAFLTPDAALQGLGIVLSLLVAMGVMLKVMDSLNNGDESKGFNAKGFLMLGAGLLLVVLSVGTLAKTFERENGADAFSSVMLILGVMSAIMYASVKWGNGAVAISAIGSFIFFGASLWLLGKTIQGLTKFNWTQLWPAMVTISAVLVALGLMLGFAKNLLYFGAKQGKGFVLVGLAIVAIAGAIRILADVPWASILKSVIFLGVSMTALMVGLSFFINSVQTEDLAYASIALVAVATALLLIAGALWVVALIPLGSLTKAEFALGLFISLLAFLSANGWLNNLAAAMYNFTGALKNFVVSLALLAIAAPLFHLIAAQAAALETSLITIGMALIDILVALAGPIAEAVFVIIAQILISLNAHIDEIANELFDLLVRLTHILISMLPDLFILAGESIADLILDLLATVSEFIFGVDFFDFRGKKQTMDEFWNDYFAMKKAERKLRYETSALQTSADSILGNLDITRNLGSNTDDSIANSFDGIKSSLFSQISALSQDTENHIPKAFDLQSISDSLGYNATGVIDLSQLSTFAEEQGFDIGTMIPEGMLEGIQGFDASQLYNGSFDLASLIQSGAEDALEIHSPSKVAQNISENFVGTLENSLISNKSALYNSAFGLTNSAVEGAESGYYTLLDYLNSNIEDPVIRPVLDLTEIQNGIYWMNSNLPQSSSVSLANDILTTQNVNYDSVTEANQDLANRMANQDSLVQSVNNLNEQVALLSERMTKVAIYLDTGKLVGEMTDELDANMGGLIEASIRGGR